jgi:argininosuccinate lyase
VALAEELDKPLNLLTLKELKSVDKQFGRDALAVFDLQRAMAKRNIVGAPGTKEVAKQLARWREQLSFAPRSRQSELMSQSSFGQ